MKPGFQITSMLLVCGFVMAILAIFSVYLYIESGNLKAHTEALESENAELSADLGQAEDALEEEKKAVAALASELDSTNSLLLETNNSLGKCQQNLSTEITLYEECTEQRDELTQSLLEASSELQNISAELDGFQEQIADSMAWFKANSDIGNLSFRLRYLADKCTSGDEINAACIPFILQEEEGWGFKSEKKDRLLSLEEMVSNKGGDCEDWSLYFKAVFNYIKSEARNEKSLVSVVPSRTGGNFPVYKDWYYVDAAGKKVGTTEDNMYVICYDSHCVVAVTDEEVKNSSDIYKLRGAPAVEPQDGQYVFTIGGFGAPDICSPDSCNYAVDIWIVITDDDIYDFHYNREWTGYKDYYEKTEYYKEQIADITSLVEGPEK